VSYPIFKGGSVPPPLEFGKSPMCEDPQCFRSRPHYPREYGCRWSDFAIVGRDSMVIIMKDEHGNVLPEPVKKQAWF
jgi:hypothetical protein